MEACCALRASHNYGCCKLQVCGIATRIASKTPRSCSHYPSLFWNGPMQLWFLIPNPQEQCQQFRAFTPTNFSKPLFWMIGSCTASGFCTKESYVAIIANLCDENEVYIPPMAQSSSSTLLLPTSSTRSTCTPSSSPSTATSSSSDSSTNFKRTYHCETIFWTFDNNKETCLAVLPCSLSLHTMNVFANCNFVQIMQ